MTDDSHHLEDWLTDLDRSGKSSHTVAAYRRALEHFTNWNRQTYGTTDFEPAKVIPRDVRDWKAYQQTVEKAAVSTIAQRVTALTQFFRWAKREGMVDANPADDVSVSTPKRFQPKSLDAKDLRKLLRAVHAGGSRRDVAIIETLAGTGLRVSELLRVQLGDLEINPRSGKLVVREGKHGGSRTVPLVVEVRNALTGYLEAEHPLVSEHVAESGNFLQGDPRRGERDTLNRVFADHPNEPLWHGERGPLVARSAIRRILDRYTLAARIEPIGPHVLRHTFAYNFLQENSGNLRGLAAILGHKNLDTVMVYTEPHFEDLAEQMERASRSNGS